MSNIVLVGMPGSGKSTQGRALAKLLGRKFIDTDTLIEQVAGVKLQRIIDLRGNDYLLEFEHQVCLHFMGEGYIVATGGSAVYHEDSIKALRGENGIVLYIKISPETMKERIHNLETRGIILKPGQTLEDLYEYRTSMYEAVADLTIETDGLSKAEGTLKLATTMVEAGAIKFSTK